MRTLAPLLALLVLPYAASAEWSTPETAIRTTKGKIAAALVVSELIAPEGTPKSDGFAKIIEADPKIAEALKGVAMGRVNVYDAKKKGADKKLVAKWGKPMTIRLYVGGGPKWMWRAELPADADDKAIAQRLSAVARAWSGFQKSLDRIVKQYKGKNLKSKELNNARAQTTLAKAFERAKSVDLAFKHHDLAIKAHIKAKDRAKAMAVVRDKARFAEQQGEWKRATKLLREWIKKNKKSTDRAAVILDMCRIYRANGDEKNAVKFARQVLKDKTLESQHGPARKFIADGKK